MRRLMVVLTPLIVLMLILGSIGCSTERVPSGSPATSTNTKVYSYRDAALSYYGRWNDTGEGMRTGWESSQVWFKTEPGTDMVKVRMGYTGKWPGYAVPLVDNNDASGNNSIPAVTEWEGTDRVTTFNVDPSEPHTIIIKLTDGTRTVLIEGGSAIWLKSIEVNDNGAISPNPQKGIKKIAFFGDSWTSVWNDWQRFMDLSRFEIWPIGTDGFEAYHGNKYYPLIYKGQVQHDPKFDGIVIAYGINDYNAGVKPTEFKSYVEGMVDQIRSYQPGVKIFLIQAPRCDVSNPVRYYDEYGDVLQEIADSQQDVIYLSTAELWSTLEWSADYKHLAWTPNGRQLYANYMSQKISQYYTFP